MISAVVGDELLAVLREQAGLAGVTYAEPPVLLTGGFFTENYAFRLAAPPPWDEPLVVRLFPLVTPPRQAHREATIQRVLCDQGYGAAAVRFFDDSLRLDGREFFVMSRLPGTTLLGGIGMREIVTSGWRLSRQLPAVTAEVQAALHALDAQPLVDELGNFAGVHFWFNAIEREIAGGADGLRPGLEWLRANQPPAPARLSICHGDLWAGNILMHDGAVSGVLDWTTTTVGDPALDIGFTTMSLKLAPVPAPRPVQRAMVRTGHWLAARYVGVYQRLHPIDVSSQPYYEAMRCVAELSWVAKFRIARANGVEGVPEPTWGLIAPDMVEFFRRRSGVTLQIPR